jgi:hypothetical protein
MRHAAALLLLPTLLFGVDPKAVRPHTLANGMKVIIEEDHDIPSVAMYLSTKSAPATNGPESPVSRTSSST